MSIDIPQATKKRLPQYLRLLYDLKQKGNERIRSYQIGNMLDISNSTVRKDFHYLQSVGKSAYGYNIDELIHSLEKELGSNKQEKIILIGVGVLGTALLKYNFISNRVGKIVAAFDSDPQKTNQKNYGVPVHHISKISKKILKDVHIAMLAIPKEEIDIVVNQLVKLNIQAIINFSDGIPRKRKNVKIYNIDFAETVTKAIYNCKK